MANSYWLHRISHEGEAAYALLDEGYLTIGWSDKSDTGVLEHLDDDQFELILSRLVDTFISKISLTMLPVPKPHNTACVLSWEEARRWQSRSSGYSSS